MGRKKACNPEKSEEMKRIWTREELEKADFGKLYEEGDFYHFKESYCINTSMFGKSVEWCEENTWIVKDWMIAKPTHQEPKEGDFVYVWDKDKKPEPLKRIFIAKVKYGCLTLDVSDIADYCNGLPFRVILWKHYEPIPQLTAQEIADKVGVTVEELRGIVNS